jgi:NAD(P)H-quinone oxidoreductase subunit 4
MLREVFFHSDVIPVCGIGDAAIKNKENEGAVCFGNSCVLPSEAEFSDANPREIFIALCFLIMIIGVGLYPKLATQLYDVKTVALNAEIRQSYTEIAQAKSLQGLQSEVATVFDLAR